MITELLLFICYQMGEFIIEQTKWYIYNMFFAMNPKLHYKYIDMCVILSHSISVNSPYLCMAYKIPNGLQVNLRFLLDKNENTDGCSWYYMPFVNGLDPSSSSCTLSAFEADIVDDDR